ncbi:bromodomain-containing protein 4-like [Phlebotomus argentipes]|uniref:bromodomain-containing protein 4-like n=1 Tax=Phlebotomus argentipes TaxID=94469 RepID=UPI00289331CF|nr:bromodomain-containing protein 4-like [Phlebotomus argentipes]
MTSHSPKASTKIKKATKSSAAAIEMSDALANTETAAEYVNTAIKMWNGPKPVMMTAEASKKSQMKYDVFDPKQAAELLHMHQFDPQMYQVPQSVQSMQIPTHYVAPTQYVLEPAYEEQEQVPQQYHPTTLPPQHIVTVQPVVQKKPIELVEVEAPTQAPRYARPTIRKPSKPVKQKIISQDSNYEVYQNVVTVTKPEPFELPTSKAPVQKEIAAESQRTPIRNPTTYTVEQGGETHIHHHYAPVHHQQYEEETVEIAQEIPTHRPKYVVPRARTKPTTHTFQVQHHQAATEEHHEHTTPPYRPSSSFQQTLKATSRPLTHHHHHHPSLTSEVEKDLASQSYQIEIPRDELIKHIEDSVNKYLKNLNLEEKLVKERPRPSYVPRSQQHVMIVSTTPPPPPPPPTTTPVSTTTRPVRIPKRRRPVMVQQSQPQAEVGHEHQEQHIIVSNDEYLPPSFVVHQSHPNQVQHHPEPIVVTQPTKVYAYEEVQEPSPDQVYRQPKIVHQEQYQAQYPPTNELARESVVQNVDLTDQNSKSRPTHIDLSALDVGQSWSHGNTFDHSAVLKNLQGFDQSNAVLQPIPHPKLHFNSQTYHDINALPYNPNRDFVSTVEPAVAASAMQPTDDATFFKKQSFGPMPHNTVNMNEGTASVGASISVGGEQSVPGLRDEQVKSITDELGPVHIINGLPVVNPYNIDLHTLKFMLGSPMAPGNTNVPQQQQQGPASVSEVPPPVANQKPRKNIQYTRENGWTNSVRAPSGSGSAVQYKYTGNELPADSYSPKYNNNPKGEGFQGGAAGSKVHNAHQNGSQFELVPKGRVKVVEQKRVVKRPQAKGREPDTELKPPPRFPKYN